MRRKKGLSRIIQQTTYILFSSLLISFPAWAGKINSDFIRAAAKGDTTTVKNLITDGADVNAKDYDDWTALMWAARRGYTDTVRAILAEGGDVNAINLYGFTALMWAAKGGYVDIVKEMLGHGVNVYARNMGGFTAFMYASTEGHDDIIKVLQPQTADAKAKNGGRITSMINETSSEKYTDTIKLTQTDKIRIYAQAKKRRELIRAAARSRMRERLNRL